MQSWLRGWIAKSRGHLLTLYCTRLPGNVLPAGLVSSTGRPAGHLIVHTACSRYGRIWRIAISVYIGFENKFKITKKSCSTKSTTTLQHELPTNTSPGPRTSPHIPKQGWLSWVRDTSAVLLFMLLSLRPGWALTCALVPAAASVGEICAPFSRLPSLVAVSLLGCHVAGMSSALR